MGNAIRTAEELRCGEYNYYLALKLDPSVRDVSVIEAALKSEINKWTLGTPYQRRLKELYSDIERVMLLDPQARAEEAKNAKRLQLDDAIRVCDLLARRGYIRRDELESIVESRKIPCFTVEELEETVRSRFPFGVTYAQVDPNEARIPAAYRMDFQRYGRLDRVLVTTDEAEFYELIESGPNDSPDQMLNCMLRVSAVAAYGKDWQSARRRAVCKYAISIVQHQGSIAAYQNYSRTSEVWNDLGTRNREGIRTVSKDEYRELIAKLMQLLPGVKPLAAETMLKAGLRYWHLSVGDSVERVTVRVDQATIDPSHRFDFRRQREIASLLRITKHKTLYEALGVQPSNHLEVAYQINQVWSNIRIRTTPEGVAMDKLIGYAKVLSRDSVTWNTYYSYLETREIWDELELLCAYRIRAISDSMYQRYVEKIVKALGTDASEAERVLLSGMMKYDLIRIAD